MRRQCDRVWMRYALRCLFLNVASVFALAASAYAVPPTLTHLFPAGGQRGAKVTVTCAGKFSWPTKAWAPGIEVTPAKESGKIDIAIPADLAADRVWIRLYNDDGISAAVPFLIGSLKELEEKEPNNSPRNAQPIADGQVTVNGVLQEKDVDGFAIALTAGQTLVASLDANDRLGSPMDAILQVAAQDGTVLAENHDDIGLDPRLAYTATKAGTYIVRVFAFPSNPDSTIAFRGGSNFIYRLTMTTGPFITHAVPLSVTRAAPSDVEVMGWNIPPGTKLPVTGYGGTRLGDHQELEVLGDRRVAADARLGIVFANGYGGAARVRLVPHVVAPGIAKTSVGEPMTLQLPTATTGCIKSPRHVDYFRVPLKKGQQLVATVESRSLDLTVTPVVQLTSPSGATVADIADPGPTNEVAIAHTADQDGDYRLTIRDRFRHAEARSFYRLTVRLQEPDFELAASADAVLVTKDKPTEFPLVVQRRAVPGDNIGPIKIEVLGLPPGVTSPTVVSEPTGPSAAKVKLKFTSTGAPFSGPIRILGTTNQPTELKRFARTPPSFSTCFETLWLTAVAKP